MMQLLSRGTIHSSFLTGLETKSQNYNKKNLKYTHLWVAYQFQQSSHHSRLNKSPLMKSKKKVLLTMPLSFSQRIDLTQKKTIDSIIDHQQPLPKEEMVCP